MRQTHATDGRLCATCLGRAYRKHQLSNLVFGWWGMISFFMTWAYLVNNTVTYFQARGELQGMASRSEKRRVAPQGSPSERLEPFRYTVRLRLRNAEDLAAIASDLADTHQVPLSDARAFVDALAAEPVEALERA
ncbi:MAG: hypothetical protein ABI672_13065 [Vicinamibacteria bacterium]